MAFSCFCAIPSAFGNVRLAFDSTSLDFGNVAVSGAKDLTVEVWDTSSANIEIDQFMLGGFDAGDFTVLSPTTPLVISAGGIHTKIIVQFSPQALGARSASLQIETTDGILYLPLTGMGTGKESSLAWSVPSMDFDTITPGSERDSIVELYSTGTDTALLTVIELASADTSFTAQVVGSSQPPLRLAPGDSVAVLLAFRGYSTGLKDAQLSALGSISNSPACLLTGDVELGSFEIQPPSLIDFGTMYAGQIRDSTIFLINTSPFDLTIVYLSLSPSGDDFTILNPPSVPFTLGAGDTLGIPIRANPGLTTSHAADLQVLSPSADNRFQKAHLTVSVIPAPIAAPLHQELTYYCASGAFLSDTVPVTNTGGNALVITGLSFEDTNIRLQTNLSFPDTVAAGTMQTLILGFDPSAASKDTLVLQFIGGTQVMLVDTISLRPSLAAVSATLSMASASGTRQAIAVAASAPLGVFQLDSIVVHLNIQDSNVASIDPATIALAPSLSNASIVSVVPTANGYDVIISSSSPILLPAGSPLINFALDRFVSATDSTNVSVAIETPERSGCIEWSNDTIQAGGLAACGSRLLQEALLQRPLILSADLRQDPVTGSNADLRIDASREQYTRITLSNALGETIYRDKLDIQSGRNDYSLPLTSLPSGTYIVRLVPENGSPLSVQFLKLH
ncbi:MAG TPA: choice-of-anchor D domain-containing protein [Candidatus Kapabacteria bacterium]|nr:choice-of-anchor D domain-containing protein [Candidatus Kapabacteria bacterium]